MSTTLSPPMEVKKRLLDLMQAKVELRVSALEAVHNLMMREALELKRKVHADLKSRLAAETDPRILDIFTHLTTSWFALPPTVTKTPSINEIQYADMVELEMLDYDEDTDTSTQKASSSTSSTIDLTNSPPLVAPTATAKRPIPAKPTSATPSAFNLLMGQSSKKRSPPGDLNGWGKTKKAKYTSLESKFVPSSSASFLANLDQSSNSGLASEVSTSIFAGQQYSPSKRPQNVSMVTGCDVLGAPAPISTPQRSPFSSKPTMPLPSYSTPKSLQTTRSLGTMADVQTNARQMDMKTSMTSSFFPSSSTTSSISSFQPTSASFSTSLPNSTYASSSRPLPGSLKPTSSKPGMFYSAQSGGSLASKKPPAPRKTLDIATVVISPELSSEQRKIVEKAIAGESFFFTGPAGTGKSHVLKEIIRIMRDCYDPTEMTVVAPTGMAAVQIGGQTIHSWSGIGLGKKPPKDLLIDVKRNPRSVARWKSTRVLIVDEVSMLSKELFDKLYYIATNLLNKPKFGGIQLILCGDFFQLPPVVTAAERTVDSEILAFESKNWAECIPHTYTLTQIFRQVGDLAFVNMLNELRQGIVSDETYAKLRSCIGKALPRSNVEPTRLFPKKEQVGQFNNSCLERLAGQLSIYNATDTLMVGGSEHHKKSLEDNCPAPTVLGLKVNAQVVLLRNRPDYGLVNGSRGIVIGFEPPPNPGIAGLPIVRFETGTEIVVTPDKWEVQQGAQVMATRDQIPLNLAWALSIHKSQGMTITQIEVSLRDTFEDGQAYVALSRVTSLEGLRIREDFLRERITASASVRKFYRDLQTVNDGSKEANK